MNNLQVNKELLETILDASMKTAFNYRGKSNEMYSLGCLESTANLIYILLIQINDDECELARKSQHFAKISIDRMKEWENMNARGADKESSEKIEQIRG